MLVGVLGGGGEGDFECAEEVGVWERLSGRLRLRSRDTFLRLVSLPDGDGWLTVCRGLVGLFLDEGRDLLGPAKMKRRGPWQLTGGEDHWWWRNWLDCCVLM